MLVEMRPIGAIQPYHNNPRLNDAAVDAVAESIRAFSFRQPIVVDEQGVIIAGHTRYKAALKLGLKEVPVHVATGLTPEQVRAYRIADNQTARLSEWDHDRLVEELLALQSSGFDVDLTGFPADELMQLLQPDAAAGLTDPDDVPEPPDEAARVDDALYYAVRPMLAVSQGRLVALSTPFGKRGWFHDEWHGSGDWERVRITAEQCPRISREFLAEERRALGERYFRQEFLTSFEDCVDAVFSYQDIQVALSPDIKPLFAR